MPNDSKTSLAIIFVLYRNYETMQDYLIKQRKTKPINLKFVIVDNTPHLEVNRDVLKEFSKLTNTSILIAEPENLGYAGAAHFAMSKLPELYHFDYVAISNTDLLFDAVNFLEVLQNLRDEHKCVGAIAPRLIKSDGSSTEQLHYIDEPSRQKYQRLSKIFAHYPLAVTHRLAADLKRVLSFKKRTKELPRDIFAPHGALMLLTSAFFQNTTGFHHPAFLFCEEITIGAKCRDSKLKVIYEPRLTYSHQNHGSMGSFPSRRIVRYLHEAHTAVLQYLK